jgi:flavin reductase (DIM6/NTAB) family NADH-FMN oxidoreductase RutF
MTLASRRSPLTKELTNMELDQAAKKKILRDFTYGLYAVTAAHDGERGIFTANWLSQASFEPPLVMLSVENDSSTLPLIRASRRFAICPLAEGQKELAGALGRPRVRAGDKFATLDLAVVATGSGVPALADSLGYVVCAVHDEVPAGDSVVFIAEVIEARVFADSPPLEMRQAGFRHAG